MSAVAFDPRSGLHLPQAWVGIRKAKISGIGSIIYRCHSCGELITRKWECLFVDTAPGREWASNLVPPKTTPTTTTHHDWHMASQQYEER